MKEVAIFWTGGLDSTYLILKNLFIGNTIRLWYVDIKNNGNDMKAEKIARDKIMKDIKKLFKSIDFKVDFHSYVHAICEVSVSYMYDYPYAQVPLFFTAIANMISSCDEIQLGFVYNDYGNVKEFTDRLQKIYKSYIDLATNDGEEDIGRIAQLRFPLIETTKQEEILLFQSLDSMYKTHFLENMIHCEEVKAVNGVLTNCGECKACENYEKAFNSLVKNKEKYQ